MGRKPKVITDFSVNPQNIQIGDWVVHEGQRAKDKGQRNLIGEVVDRVNNNGDMLQFWVSWFDSISNHPTPELACNLIKIPKSQDGYVGKEISSGLISSMIWTGDEVKYQVYKDKQTIVKTREQIESALNSKTVNINSIIIDQNLQQRVKLDHGVIDDYADIYRCAEGNASQEGVELPPITVWKCTDELGNSCQVSANRYQVSGDSEENATARYYLVDGFHRVAAAKQAGIEELPFIEKSGTYREALLFSLSVNATHGLRRSNADKRKAVMTLLNDEEWSMWSNRTIAKKCQVSASLVDKLRNEFFHNHNFTANKGSDNQANYKSNLTANKSSGNQENNDEVTRTYITKDGVEAKMRVGNIGKGKSSKSLPPEENEVLVIDDAPIEVDEAQIDDELTDSTNSKTSKGKQKITNPLSVGDRVKVKDNHYFGGKEGVVTQITSPTYVLVAFDDNQRELIRLKDLDLPESLSQPQKPQKKEIFIKEGLNYKAGIPGYGCKWYVEVDEEIYRGLQIYQKRVSTPTMNGAFSRLLVEKGILKYHPEHPTQLLDLKDTELTIKTLNLSVTTVNLLQRYVRKYGEEAIVSLLKHQIS